VGFSRISDYSHFACDVLGNIECLTEVKLVLICTFPAGFVIAILYAYLTFYFQMDGTDLLKTIYAVDKLDSDVTDFSSRPRSVPLTGSRAPSTASGRPPSVDSSL
jgi:hypothetical protein